MKSYRHIDIRDRKKIAKLKSYKLSISEIARRTGFNKSTISRELKRNGGNSFFSGSYLGQKANNSASSRRSAASRRKIIPSEIDHWIVDRILEDWTPEQIAGRSGMEFSRSVSHEYIYRLIIEDKKAGGKLHHRLKRFRKRKQRLSRREYGKPSIVNRTAISERPEVANERSRIGDLEGDLIAGHRQSGYILTVIDRKTRLVALELLMNREMATVQAAFLRAFKRMPVVKTLTLDNAREFNCHSELTRRSGIKVYFADPYASHQRGSVENMNGCLRYYFPKKMNFTKIEAKSLRSIEQRLNSRPRKILGYLTPEELAFRK